MTSNGDRDKPRRRWWLWLLLGALLLVLPVGGYFGYEAFRTWRALDLAEEAQRLLENDPGQSEIREANDKSRSAYRIRPENLEVVRLTARVQDQLAPQRSAGFWQEAVRLSGGAQ